MKKHDRTKSFKVNTEVELALDQAAKDRSLSVSTYVRHFLEWTLARQGYIQEPSFQQGIQAVFGRNQGMGGKPGLGLMTQTGPDDEIHADQYNFIAHLDSEKLKTLDVMNLVLDWFHLEASRKAHAPRLFVVFSELFQNALDYGVLALDSQIKATSSGLEQYWALRQERLHALTQGSIIIGMRQTQGPAHTALLIRIKDSGTGFDHGPFLAAQGTEGIRPTGHGIPLVKSLCKESHYIGNGSEAIAHYVLKKM